MNPLSPSSSIDIAPSPASFVSITNGTPPDASPAISENMNAFSDSDGLWDVPNRQVPMAQVQPMYNIRGNKRACVAPNNASMETNQISPGDWSPNAPGGFPPVVIEEMPQLTVMADELNINDPVITEL